jgi:GNAT superfamily N-acetyltransferase
MAITYTEERNFTLQQVSDLFLCVRWVVGKYPNRLYKALMNSSRVISAWDGDRLVGLIRVMGDSEIVCFINYVLVHPDYHGRGFAGHLLEMVKAAYKSYLYINVMIGDSKNVAFYEKHGFKVNIS